MKTPKVDWVGHNVFYP